MPPKSSRDFDRTSLFKQSEGDALIDRLVSIDKSLDDLIEEITELVESLRWVRRSEAEGDLNTAEVACMTEGASGSRDSAPSALRLPPPPPPPPPPPSFIDLENQYCLSKGDFGIKESIHAAVKS
ncbi:hypothetical protein TcWFU_005107 [Taenia crassiceps]|uniref:Uncharacterized protein n=1 Tax=Taenia crassiceps TaxID=6207 RepID=A0ABR4QR03_9CEST